MALRNNINAQAKSDIINYSSAVDGQAYTLLGENAMGDRTSRTYFYDASSTAIADGDNVLAATGMGGIGRFIKSPVEEFNSGVPVPTNLAGVSVIVTKKAMGIVTPNTGNGYSINISGVGFTNVLSCSVIPIKNATSAPACPKVSIKSISNTAVVVNITEGNDLLQLGLLLGTSEKFADVAGLSLMVVVEGN